MIGIIGSRNFPFEIFNSKIDEAYKNFVPDSVVTGDATGVDNWVAIWCRDSDIDCCILDCLRRDIPTYYLHRDAEIVALSDGGIIAFWDGKSRGTNFTMRYGAMRGRRVLVIDSKGKEYWFGEVI